MEHIRARLERRLLTDDSTGCREWIGYRNPHGYGHIRVKEVSDSAILTHRLSWMVFVGPIPPGLHVLHKCDNPPCCNPQHLFIGTPADNAADKVAKDRQSRNETGYLPSGADHHFYEKGFKLTRAEAMSIREDKRMNKDIAEHYGVDRSLVSLIKTGKIWR